MPLKMKESNCLLKYDLSPKALQLTKPNYNASAMPPLPHPKNGQLNILNVSHAGDFIRKARNIFYNINEGDFRMERKGDETNKSAHHCMQKMLDLVPEYARMDTPIRNLYRNFADSPDPLEGEDDKLRYSRREMDIILFALSTKMDSSECHKLLLSYRELESVENVFRWVKARGYHKDEKYLEYMSHVEKCVNHIISTEHPGVTYIDTSSKINHTLESVEVYQSGLNINHKKKRRNHDLSNVCNTDTTVKRVKKEETNDGCGGDSSGDNDSGLNRSGITIVKKEELTDIFDVEEESASISDNDSGFNRSGITIVKKEELTDIFDAEEESVSIDTSIKKECDASIVKVEESSNTVTCTKGNSQNKLDSEDSSTDSSILPAEDFDSNSKTAIKIKQNNSILTGDKVTTESQPICKAEISTLKDADKSKNDDNIHSMESSITPPTSSTSYARDSDFRHQNEKLRNELELLRRAHKDQYEKLKKLEEETKHEKEHRHALEEDQDKQANEIDVLCLTNKDLVERLEKLEEQRGKIKKKMVPNLDNDSLSRYRKAFAAFFNTGGKLTMQLEPKEQDRLVIKVPEIFNMQDFFDVCYDRPKDKNSASVLFHTLDKKIPKGILRMRNYYGYKIVNKWNVIFTNIAKRRKKANMNDTSLNEGGRSREFLSQCWRQMGRLRIWTRQGSGKKTKGKKREGIRLFDTQANGVVPIQDCTLAYKLQRAFPNDRERYNSAQRAKAYYRAIGRIMLHSLANGYTISASVMPPLYQNWLLRGCSPKDSDYHNDDVLQHLSEGGTGKQTFHCMVGQECEFADGTTEVVTEETIFTKVIPEQYLDTRVQALKDFQEGLTLDGNYSLCEFLRSFPLEAVQKVAFSSPHLSAAGIIALLEPVYCVGWEQTDKDGKTFCIGSETDRIEHQHKQETFFKEVLCKILTEKGNKGHNKYLSQFVKFCTKYDYLPDRDGDPDFRIIVEFNFEESAENSFPMAYPCANTLKLPGSLYTDNRQGFRRKLDEAMKIYGTNFLCVS